MSQESFMPSSATPGDDIDHATNTHQPGSLSAMQIDTPLWQAVAIDLDQQAWTLESLVDWQPSLFTGANILHQTVQTALARLCLNGPAFAEALTLNGLPLLVGVWPDDKRIRLYSPKLQQERCLLAWLNSDQPDLQAAVAAYDQLNHQASSAWQRITQQEALMDWLDTSVYSGLNQAVVDRLKPLQARLRQYRPDPMERLSNIGLDFAAQYALIRVHLLKFVALLPTLSFDTKGKRLKQQLLEALRRLVADSKQARVDGITGERGPLPVWMEQVIQLKLPALRAIPAKLLAPLVRQSVAILAQRFIIEPDSVIEGEVPKNQKAKQVYETLAKTGRGVTLDPLGELVVSKSEADAYLHRVLTLIEQVSTWVPTDSRNAAGLAEAHISIKVSALSHDFRPESPESSYEHVAPRLQKILLTAHEHQVFINIDAEHYSVRDLTLYCLRRVLLETEALHETDQVGVVLQTYLKDAPQHLRDIVDLAKARGQVLPIRVVKGAYWDAETIEAEAHGWPAPQWLNKEETDLCCRQLMAEILRQGEHVQLCLGSHNVADHTLAEILREQHYPDAPVIEHQCLHRTYEALSLAMAKEGWVVRDYVPIGNLIVGMAYLVRRILENSSQVGVLTMARSDQAEAPTPPERLHVQHLHAKNLAKDSTVSTTTEPHFYNIPPLRLFLPNEKEPVQQALERLEPQFPLSNEPCGFELTGDLATVTSPSTQGKVIGYCRQATASDVARAVETTDQAFKQGGWRNQQAEQRASVVMKAARLLLLQRVDLAALIVHESGKSIPEALADVDEAIDFCTFYAHQAVRLQATHPQLKPRGVMAVIPPWNFPLAIPCGMAVAALVCGNSVIIKPAGHTPLIVRELVQLLHQAGIPEEALVFMPGPGRSVGQALQDHPRVAGALFTGSSAVGCALWKTFLKRSMTEEATNEQFATRVVAEMGGKNIMIIGATADPDEAVAAILYSALAHAGQKCSAASRVFVDKAVKDELLERLTPAFQDIEVGPGSEWSTQVNPVVSLGEKERIQGIVKEATQEALRVGGLVHVDRSQEALPGACLGPTLIELPYEAASDPNSWAMQEIFGPVLHVVPFETLDEALELANAVPYALTGGILSQSQDEIDTVIAQLEAGNIYVNRSITGARVGIEPFGGFKLSGTGPKAGGSEYLRSLLLEDNLPWVPLASLTAQQPEALLAQLGQLLPGQKESLENDRRWLEESSTQFLQAERFNVVIPGQRSVDTFTQIRKGLLVVVEQSENISLALIRQLIAANQVACPVTVLTDTPQTFTQLAHVLEGLTIKALPESGTWDRTTDDTLWLEGSSDWKQGQLNALATQGPPEHWFCRILSPWDPASSLEEACLHLVQVRSLAVNLMRYGAPMDE